LAIQKFDPNWCNTPLRNNEGFKAKFRWYDIGILDHISNNNNSLSSNNNDNNNCKESQNLPNRRLSVWSKHVLDVPAFQIRVLKDRKKKFVMNFYWESRQYLSGVNFINIVCSTFLYESAFQSFSLISVRLIISFCWKNNGEKAALKMLMKLTVRLYEFDHVFGILLVLFLLSEKNIKISQIAWDMMFIKKRKTLAWI